MDYDWKDVMFTMKLSSNLLHDFQSLHVKFIDPISISEAAN
jgi:hypothetical protein